MVNAGDLGWDLSAGTFCLLPQLRGLGPEAASRGSSPGALASAGWQPLQVTAMAGLPHHTVGLLPGSAHCWLVDWKAWMNSNVTSLLQSWQTALCSCWLRARDGPRSTRPLCSHILSLPVAGARLDSAFLPPKGIRVLVSVMWMFVEFVYIMGWRVCVHVWVCIFWEVKFYIYVKLSIYCRTV